MGISAYKEAAYAQMKNYRCKTYMIVIFVASILCSILTSKFLLVGGLLNLALTFFMSMAFVVVPLQIAHGEVVNLGAIPSKIGKFICAYLWMIVYSIPAAIGIILFYLGTAGSMLTMFIGGSEWTVIILIVGVIGGIFGFIWSFLLYFNYAFAYFVACDESAANLSAKECLKVSKQMMKGNKMKLFVFGLSFIGWFLLCGLTLGIMTIFVIPYVQVSMAYFYEDLKNEYNSR